MTNPATTGPATVFPPVTFRNDLVVTPRHRASFTFIARMRGYFHRASARNLSSRECASYVIARMRVHVHRAECGSRPATEPIRSDPRAISEQFPGQSGHPIRYDVDARGVRRPPPRAANLCNPIVVDRARCIACPVPDIFVSRRRLSSAPPSANNTDQLIQPAKETRAAHRAAGAETGQPRGQIALPQTMGERLQNAQQR